MGTQVNEEEEETDDAQLRFCRQEIQKFTLMQTRVLTKVGRGRGESREEARGRVRLRGLAAQRGDQRAVRDEVEAVRAEAGDRR